MKLRFVFKSLTVKRNYLPYAKIPVKKTAETIRDNFVRLYDDSYSNKYFVAV